MVFISDFKKMEKVYFMAHPSGWDIKYTFSLYYCWSARSDYIAVIDDERIGKENTGYLLRHHRRLRQERPQHELREPLLAQVHQCIGDDRVDQFYRQAVPDRRVPAMRAVAGLQARAIPLQRVRRGGRDERRKGRADRDQARRCI